MELTTTKRTVTMVAQPTGKRLLNVHPGHQVGSRLVEGVTMYEEDGAVLVEFNDGNGRLYGLDDTIEIVDPYSFHPDGVGRWISCPTCYAGGFQPAHKPMDSCQSGKRPHCTCDTCF
jgi:hypothetical protein